MQSALLSWLAQSQAEEDVSYIVDHVQPELLESAALGLELGVTNPLRGGEPSCREPSLVR